METIMMPAKALVQVLVDAERLLKDVEEFMDVDTVALRRLREMEVNPAMGSTEEELDAYLRKRGVHV